jgi:putative ABC transport system ATP-binding protein
MIKLNNIVKTFGNNEKTAVHALRGITLSIEDGEFVSLMGTSGAGKTTLFNIIGLIDRPTEGAYEFDGTDTAALSAAKISAFRNAKIGFVHQHFELISEYTALENVMLPLLFAKHCKGKKEKALKALEKIGIAELAKKRVNNLSGGEKQRVAIARAIVNEPALVLADEPTGALDSETAAGVMDTLMRLNSDGTTLMLVTHDSNIAARAGRVIKISDGKISLT